jgi:hypothetical protein
MERTTKINITYQRGIVGSGLDQKLTNEGYSQTQNIFFLRLF